MSANLDKSLDELVSRRPTGRRQNRRAATKTSVGGVGGVGGVRKPTKAAPKQPIHPVHATPAAPKKIHVSGLVSLYSFTRQPDFCSHANISSLSMLLRA